MSYRKVTRRSGSSTSNWLGNAIKAWEIAVAAPQVIAYRTARMASAGANPSRRDQQEFTRMGLEKVEAFSESLMAMAAPMYEMNQKFAFLAMQQWWKMWTAPSLTVGISPAKIMQAHASLMRGLAAGAASKQFDTALSRTIGKGLAPVHRRATANAKRLGALKRR